MKDDTKYIEVENAGPVPKTPIPIPPDGGIVILTGPNGGGKTNTLNAVQLFTENRGEISIRDGEVSATVSGLGAILHVGRRTVRSGELVVESLEGKFSIADIVDPKIKKPDAADAKRIKALITLASGEDAAKPEKFYRLFAGKSSNGQKRFESLVSTSALATKDLVEMAGNIKRELEKKARELETSSERLFNLAESSRNAANGVNTKLPHDENELQQQLEKAIRAQEKLLAEAEAATKSRTAAQEAQGNLRNAEAAYMGLSVDEAQEQWSDASTNHSFALSTVADLELKLAHAKQDLAQMEAKLELANAKLDAARLHEDTMESLRNTINAELPEEVEQQLIEEATKAVITAHEALKTGVEVRTALAHLKTADEHKAKALAVEKEAIEVREASKATDEILNDEVQKLKTPLRVAGGRLVLDTKRGETFFSELSPGEKYRLVIKDIAVPAVGEHGILVLPQEAWEGLQPANQRLIDEVVKGTGVVILTAEATDDEEVSAKIYDPFPLLPEE